MEPDVVNALATWAGVGVALLVGVGGVIVGLVSLSQARDAKQLAKEVNTIAHEANDISVGSNKLSAEANEISRVTMERSSEAHDVDWDCRWRRVGYYAVVNNGRDTAFNVRVQVTVDHEVEEAEVAELAYRGEIILYFPGAEAQAREEEETRTEAARQKRQGPRLMLPMMNLDPMFGTDHYIRDRILWKTALGTPKDYDKSTNITSLSP